MSESNEETNMPLNNLSEMMEFEYNDAQKKCLKFFHSLDSNTREVLVEMPTGTGKSFMMLDRLNTQNLKTNRCVIVFPRLTLLIQFRCAYLKHEFPLFYCSASDIDSSDEFKSEEEDALATIENEKKSRKDREVNNNIILTTYVSFPKLVDDPNYLKIDLTLFDEAHHNDSQRMKDLLMDPHRKEKCGTIYHFTATPVNINKINTTNGSHFVYTFEQAIRNHLIRSYNVYVVFHLKTSEEDGVNSNTVLDEVAKISGDKFQRLLAFTGYTKHENLPPNRHNVTDIVSEWNNPGKGYNVIGLSSDNPTIDRANIKRFEESNQGKLSVLVSCRKLGEGIDIKNIDGIVFIDPRKRKKDIYQIIGRGLRLFRYSTGKPLDWSQQTPCNIILDIAIDPPPSQPYLGYLMTGVLSNLPESFSLEMFEEDFQETIIESFRLDFQKKLFEDLSNHIRIQSSSFGIFESIINTITALKVNMPCDQRHQLDLHYEYLNAESSESSESLDPESVDPNSMEIVEKSTTMSHRFNGMGCVKVKTQDDEESVFAINTGFTDYEPVMHTKSISKQLTQRTHVILDPLLKNIFKGSDALDELFKLLNGVNVETIMDNNNKENKKKRSLESLDSCSDDTSNGSLVGDDTSNGSFVADDTSNVNMNGMKRQKTSLKNYYTKFKSEDEIKVYKEKDSFAFDYEL